MIIKIMKNINKIFPHSTTLSKEYTRVQVEPIYIYI
jgi:hypothetical protein